MYPQTHFLFSFFVGMIFSKLGFFDYKIALLIGVVGLLVDLDHYIVFILRYREKDFSLRHAWNRAVKGLYAGRSFIHHEIGFVIVTGIIAWLFYLNKFTLVWIFALGYYTHLLLDFGHFNILKIKEKMIFKEEGFVMKINKFEVLLDVFLVIGILLLIF